MIYQRLDPFDLLLLLGLFSLGLVGLMRQLSNQQSTTRLHTSVATVIVTNQAETLTINLDGLLLHSATLIDQASVHGTGRAIGRSIKLTRTMG
jgi:hypothetical protein